MIILLCVRSYYNVWIKIEIGNSSELEQFTPATSRVKQLKRNIPDVVLNSENADEFPIHYCIFLSFALKSRLNVKLLTLALLLQDGCFAFCDKLKTLFFFL